MTRHSSRTFFCPNCGHESSRWMGFCSACGDRTPLIEAPLHLPSTRQPWTGTTTVHPQELADVSTAEHKRTPTPFVEMDRVLGGGLVPGSLVLFTGEPGVGKSTLLLQAADFAASKGSKVLYISGEESEQQIKLRSERLDLSGRGVYMLSETNVNEIIRHLENQLPTLAVIDSIQTLFTDEASSGPGSVAQVRECALQIMRWTKARGASVLLAGHVTKDGTLAGPRVLEHMVDVVLYLEGENSGDYRLLRSAKNRFGSTNEVAMFRMGAKGLVEISDPSQVLIAERGDGAVGSAIVPVMEGSRPLLMEVQALTSTSSLPTPKRTANGVDYNRMIMITAVLNRRARLPMANQDIIVNVAGGLRVSEPAADLALALALASSLRGLPLKSSLVAIGEVGLSGELRSASQLERRLSEASRLGFVECLLPSSAEGKVPPMKGLTLVYAPTVEQAITLALDTRQKRYKKSAGNRSMPQN